MSQVPVKWCRKRDLHDSPLQFAGPDYDGVAVVELSALREVVEGLKGTTASLVAAVSILEHGRNRIKQVVASDTMFDLMIADYKRSIAEAQRLLASLGEVGE